MLLRFGVLNRRHEVEPPRGPVDARPEQERHRLDGEGDAHGGHGPAEPGGSVDAQPLTEHERHACRSVDLDPAMGLIGVAQPHGERSQIVEKRRDGRLIEDGGNLYRHEEAPGSTVA